MPALALAQLPPYGGASNSSGSGNSSSSSSSSSSRKASPYFSLALKGIKGAAGSDDNKYAIGRDLFMYGGEALLGIRQKNWLLAVSGEFNHWVQRTKPAEVYDTNMAGNQVNVAPALGLSFGRFILIGKLYAYSKMRLEKEDIAGNEIAYVAPSVESFAVQLNMRLAGSTFIGVEYGQVTYKKLQRDGKEEALSSDQRIKYGGWGVLYGLKF